MISKKKWGKVDISGMKFGRWTVIRKDEECLGKDSRYFCKCECGVFRSVTTTSLNSGKSTSCGCLAYESIKKAKTTHGMSGSSEYNIWHKMKARCGDKNEINYADYGGRGIAVCERWVNSFENFINDMGLKPSSSHSIDRIDNSKGYSPDNCRWATLVEQASNRGNSVFVTVDEITDTVSGWARRIGVKVGTLHQRIYGGMTGEEAIRRGPVK